VCTTTSDGELISAMTAGSQGPEEGAGGAPHEDDPFGYLYRPAEGAPGAEQQQPPAAPRTAYRPMEVGRAQYGAQPPSYPQQQPYPQQSPYPQQQQQQQRPGYGGEPAGQLPHQQSRYAERSRPQPGEDAPRGRGKGAAIGVVAVIAAIAIGSGIALTGGGSDGKKDTAGAGTSTSAGHSTGTSGAPSPSGSSSASASSSPSAAAAGGFVDASKAQAGGGAALAGSIKGAVSADGSYLTMNQGSTATFTVNAPTAGLWRIWFHYGNASGGAVKASVTVNGADHTGGTTFKSWSSSDPAQSWSYTWISPQLQAGTNTIVVATTGGPVMLDQMAVTTMDVTGSYPSQGAGGAAVAASPSS
jgi:hypothetical protein